MDHYQVEILLQNYFKLLLRFTILHIRLATNKSYSFSHENLSLLEQLTIVHQSGAEKWRMFTEPWSSKVYIHHFQWDWGK